MRKAFLICIINWCLINPSVAQLKNVEFKDGTKIQYEVVENNTDNAKKGVLKIGFGSIGIGYQYSNPDKFEVSAGVSLFSGAYAGVLYSLYKYKKEKNVDLPVKEISGAKTTTTYMISGEKIINSNFIGLHAGARYFSGKVYSKSLIRLVTDVLYETNMFPYEGAAFFGGIGKFKTRRMKYFVNEVNNNNKSMRSYTKKSGIYADLMYYPASLKYNLYNPLTDKVEPYNEFDKIGYLFYYDVSYVSSSRINKNGWGLCFQLGLGKGPAGLIALLGFGIAI
jgi:hypothetical protein